jgi:hypothetical protein
VIRVVTIALVLAVALAAGAQSSHVGPLSITIVPIAPAWGPSGAPSVPMSCCVGCPFTTPWISSIVPHDRGGGVVEADVALVSTTGLPVLSVTRSGHHLHVRIDAPRADDACMLRARVTGVPAGTYVVHLEAARDMPIAAPLGRVVSAGGELAHAALTVR